METVALPQNKSDSLTNSEDELQLLLEWEDDEDRSRWRQAGLLSVLAHVAAGIVLILLPPARSAAPHMAVETRRVTPLIAPPAELTQKAPNRGKVSNELNVEAVPARPRIQIPPSVASTTRRAAPNPPPLLPPPVPKQSAPNLPEPPKIEASTRDTTPPKTPGDQTPLPPQIQSQERPKLALENVGPTNTTSVPKAPGKLSVPAPSVNEAVRQVARGGSSGGLTVGDMPAGPGGIGEGLNLPPAPGRTGSNLELLSDPMGVDFRPYLLQILATVRRNWFAVMPESAKLGRRGKVAIQFAIARNGSIPKLVIAQPSGADALDRAAVTGISMSHPFPALPGEFKGDQIRLQFTFMYNMPVNQ